VRRLMTLGTVAAIGFTSLAVGAITSPARADFPCASATSMFIHVINGGVSVCEDGHNVTYGMSNYPVDYIITGARTGWLSRRSDGVHVNFAAYKDITFSPAVNFNYLHFN
jgi:hypothetical protein